MIFPFWVYIVYTINTIKHSYVSYGWSTHEAFKQTKQSCEMSKILLNIRIFMYTQSVMMDSNLAALAACFSYFVKSLSVVWPRGLLGSHIYWCVASWLIRESQILISKPAICFSRDIDYLSWEGPGWQDIQANQDVPSFAESHGILRLPAPSFKPVGPSKTPSIPGPEQVTQYIQGTSDLCKSMQLCINLIFQWHVQWVWRA